MRVSLVGLMCGSCVSVSFLGLMCGSCVSVHVPVCADLDHVQRSLRGTDDNSARRLHTEGDPHPHLAFYAANEVCEYGCACVEGELVKARLEDVITGNF